MKKYISYYRVSTDRQGVSGLGLDAQKSAITQYLRSNNGELLAEYSEVESGKKKNRPELARAVAKCKREKAVLIIAKLDRLARNVHFISGLMESGVDFVACDNPHANKLMAHILAAFAEHEREVISQRTKDALQEAKKRGVILGKTGKIRAKENKQKADEHARMVAGVVIQLQEIGVYKVADITKELNIQRIPTPRGGRGWHRSSTTNLLKRLRNMGLLQ